MHLYSQHKNLQSINIQRAFTVSKITELEFEINNRVGVRVGVQKSYNTGNINHTTPSGRLVPESIEKATTVVLSEIRRTLVSNCSNFPLKMLGIVYGEEEKKEACFKDYFEHYARGLAMDGGDFPRFYQHRAVLSDWHSSYFGLVKQLFRIGILDHQNRHHHPNPRHHWHHITKSSISPVDPT